MPGIWYLAALKDISNANAGTVTTILAILMFNVIMFALAEVPLIGYAIEPDATRVRVKRFQTWMSEHAMTLPSGPQPSSASTSRPWGSSARCNPLPGACSADR